MKKKALSLLLTLCMVMSLLPVSAFAAETAGVTDNYKLELNVAENPAVQYNGQNTLELGFGVQSNDLKVRNAASIVFVVDTDVLTLVSKDGNLALEPSETPNTKIFNRLIGKK